MGERRVIIPTCRMALRYCYHRDVMNREFSGDVFHVMVLAVEGGVRGAYVEMKAGRHSRVGIEGSLL